MGIREHTTYTVECDECGAALASDCNVLLPDGSITWQFIIVEGGEDADRYTSQINAHSDAVRAGWRDDTFATHCPDHVGLVTGEGEEASDD